MIAAGEAMIMRETVRKTGMAALVSAIALVFSTAWGVRDLGGQDKVRVYITDSQSWTVGGGTIIGEDVGVGGGSGGARPQTAEIIKSFRERCPSLVVTGDKSKANYVVLLDHEGGKSMILRDNKVVVFNSEGDVIYSGSTRSLGNAVKDACSAIEEVRRTQP
jgi:hypothetical protein